MLVTLLVSLAAFTLLYIAFVVARYRHGAERDALALTTDNDA